MALPVTAIRHQRERAGRRWLDSLLVGCQPHAVCARYDGDRLAAVIHHAISEQTRKRASMGVKVYISHADEDIQRCAPLLRTLESWQVSCSFDARDRRSGQTLSQTSQQALVECAVLLRVC